MTLRVNGIEGARIDYWIIERDRIVAHGWHSSFAGVLRVFEIHRELRQ